MGQTTRMVLPYPEGTDTPDVPLDMKELADRLAAIAAGWLPSNTLANRPAPVAGLDRHLFYAHDQGEVSLCVDPGNDGSYTWITVYPVPQPDLSGYATDTELNNGLAGKANTGHTHAAGDVTSGTLAIGRIPVVASGTSSTTAVVRADDVRLSDARVPTAHTHDDRYYTEAETGELLAGKSNTGHTHAAIDVNAGVFATARLGTGVADVTKFLRGDGAWTAPPGAQVVSGSYIGDGVTPRDINIGIAPKWVMILVAANSRESLWISAPVGSAEGNRSIVAEDSYEVLALGVNLSAFVGTTATGFRVHASYGNGGNYLHFYVAIG